MELAFPFWIDEIPIVDHVESCWICILKYYTYIHIYIYWLNHMKPPVWQIKLIHQQLQDSTVFAPLQLLTPVIFTAAAHGGVWKRRAVRRHPGWGPARCAMAGLNPWEVPPKGWFTHRKTKRKPMRKWENTGIPIGTSISCPITMENHHL